LLFDIAFDVLKDNIKILPFLFLAYLLIEWLERHAEEHSVELVSRHKALGPVAGGVLGVIPQCGFSAATSNLYAGQLISRGTLLAVFLSTSAEMLPIMAASAAPAGLIVKILVYKMLCGIAVGLIVDAFERRHPANRPKVDLCEQEGCHCEEEEGIIRPALFHSVKIFLFLLFTTFLVSLAVETVGEDTLQGFILNVPVAGELLAGLIGLIPNCAASVIITNLYLQGGMSVGAMLAGLLTGSGVGLLVLFRMNKDYKDDFKTLGILYVSGVLLGLLADVVFG
jgi:hypothetical protein